MFDLLNILNFLVNFRNRTLSVFISLGLLDLFCLQYCHLQLQFAIFLLEILVDTLQYSHFATEMTYLVLRTDYFFFEISDMSFFLRLVFFFYASLGCSICIRIYSSNFILSLGTINNIGLNSNIKRYRFFFSDMFED